MGVEPARIVFSGGVGGADPDPRVDGEGDREYERRLARVTLTPMVRR
jgi:hypothetical protein